VEKAEANIEMPKEAVSDYTKALQLDSLNLKAFANRGIAYLSLMLYPQAIQDFTSFLKIKPNDGLILFNRGLSYKCKYKTKNTSFSVDVFRILIVKICS